MRPQAPHRFNLGWLALFCAFAYMGSVAYASDGPNSEIPLNTLEKSDSSPPASATLDEVSTVYSVNNADCEILEYMTLDPDELGIPRDQQIIALEKDISYLWDLPVGSILVEITGFTAKYRSKFVVGLGNDVEFVFSGTVPVRLRPSHSYHVEAGGTDGFYAVDGSYNLVSNLVQGLEADMVDEAYFVKNNTDSNINNQ